MTSSDAALHWGRTSFFHDHGTELFEPEDLERARARFEALRPDPQRIPPNATT